MEPCEVCGTTGGVRAFGIDQTPLCLAHRIEAEQNTEWHEYIVAMRAQGLHIGSTWAEIRGRVGITPALVGRGRRRPAGRARERSGLWTTHVSRR
jgi:hypothetical protein